MRKQHFDVRCKLHCLNPGAMLVTLADLSSQCGTHSKMVALRHRNATASAASNCGSSTVQIKQKCPSLHVPSLQHRLEKLVCYIQFLCPLQQHKRLLCGCFVCPCLCMLPNVAVVFRHRPLCCSKDKCWQRKAGPHVTQQDSVDVPGHPL